MAIEDFRKDREKVLKDLRLEKSLDGITKQVIAKIIELLDDFSILEDGKLTTATNVKRIASEIAKLLDGLAPELTKIVRDITTGFKEIADLQQGYFARVTDRNRTAISRAINGSADRIDEVLGIATKFKNGNPKSFVEDSILDNFVTGKSLKKLISTEVRNGILNGFTKKEIVDRLRKEVDAEIANEITETILVQVRLTTKEIGDKVGLNEYYVHNGLPRPTSRDFCMGRGKWTLRKKGRAFHISEILSWKRLTWKGKPKTNYDPFSPTLGPGGFGCTDVLDPVSKEIAFSDRPILKKHFEDNDSVSIRQGVFV